MENFEFRDHTTMKVGGPAETYIKCETVAEAIELTAFLEESQKKYLVFGGGSNLLVSDRGLEATAIQLLIKKREMIHEGDNCIFSVGAGEDFDEVVAEAVAEDWAGLELLSGIPGWIGACPIQNIGAFGAEVSDIIHKVHCLDTKSGEIVTLGATECLFGYRSSIFNTNMRGRYWILSVDFMLKRPTEILIEYPDLKERLDKKTIKEILPIREAILELRKERGMVLGEDMPNSVGSFFKNPIVTAEKMKKLQADFPNGFPCYPMGDDFKIPAAWLIGKTEYKKGYRHQEVGISTFHNLCLVNHGSGTFSQLMELADLIRTAVNEIFSIELEIEPEVYS